MSYSGANIESFLSHQMITANLCKLLLDATYHNVGIVDFTPAILEENLPHL